MIRLLLKYIRRAAILIKVLVKGGEGMDYMFAFLIQAGQMTIEEVMESFPVFYDKTVQRLKAMGLDEHGQLLA